MSRYIVETDGRVVAAIDSPTRSEAETHAQSMGFLMTLRIVSRNGAPLWDGQATITVRPMTEVEWRKWNAKVLLPQDDDCLRDRVVAHVPFDMELA